MLFLNGLQFAKKVILENYINIKQKFIRYDERNILKALTVAKIHNKTFSEYKNKYCGKEIAIIATGPSLVKYIPIKNVINIGLNKSFLCDKIDLDFLFMQDWGVKSYINELENPKFDKITKFFGCAPEEYFDLKSKKIVQAIIPESVALKFNAKRYFQYSTYSVSSVHFSKDIDSNYLECGGSVVFAAMQFALYTNPKRIYLIGCDCSNGYYDDKPLKLKKKQSYIKSWLKLKEFAQVYYPDTEIVSVNPVGLKGLFKDKYQNEQS